MGLITDSQVPAHKPIKTGLQKKIVELIKTLNGENIP
jgi:hypothetical protein